MQLPARTALMLTAMMVVPASAAQASVTTIYGSFFSSGPASPGLSMNASSSSLVSLSQSDSDGYAAVHASLANGGTITSTAFGLANFYSVSGNIISGFVFDAPAKAKAKITVNVFGNVSAFGSGYATASASLGDQFKIIGTTSEIGLPTQKSFNWTLSKVLTGGSSVNFILGTLDTVNNISNTAATVAVGVGGATSYIDPVFSIQAVPEPATWAMLVTGFGLAGAMMRRRRPAAVAA